jgi:hypothetical protein
VVPTVDHFRKVFSGLRPRLVIEGVGGSGKTWLASQFATWSTSGRRRGASPLTSCSLCSLRARRGLLL